MNNIMTNKNEMLDVLSQLEKEINKTPTGPLRELLTSLNIIILTFISENEDMLMQLEKLQELFTALADESRTVAHKRFEKGLTVAYSNAAAKIALIRNGKHVVKTYNDGLRKALEIIEANDCNADGYHACSQQEVYKDLIKKEFKQQ